MAWRGFVCLSSSDIAIREDDGREETAEVVDSVPTLEGVLQFLGLTDLTESFQKEKMDYESLVGFYSMM